MNLLFKLYPLKQQLLIQLPALHLLALSPQPIKSVVDLLFKLYPLKQQLLSRHATEVLTQLCGSGAAVPTAGTAASAHLAPSTLAEILTVVLEAGDQLWDRRDADTVLHLTRLVEAGFIRWGPAAAAAMIVVM